MISTLFPQNIRGWGVPSVVHCVVYFAGSEAPFLYMTFMYYDTTFCTYILMKNTYDDRLLFYLHV